jgi:hypothetical protein
MFEQQLSIEITDQAVTVRLDVSRSAPRTRFYASIFFIGFGALVMCGLLFLPRKRGNPNMWHSLSSSPVDSTAFFVPLILLLVFALVMVLLLWRYIVSAYPSDEIFQCDRSTLTLSKVRWLDIRNKHWNTSSYALADIVKFRYHVLGRAKGASIYGLRFIVRGKKQRVLPGLKPREAEKILEALKRFGADVPDDPTRLRKLEKDASRINL